MASKKPGFKPPTRAASAGRARADHRPAPRARVRTRAQRRQQRRTLIASSIAVVVLAVVIVIAVVSRSSTAGYSTSPEAWKLPRQTGGAPVALASLHGTPVVVNFFASWCQVCRDELPVFASDAKALRGKVDFVEVNALETGNGTAFAGQFHLARSVTAVLSDVGGSNGDGLYSALGGTGSLPMTAYYSATGSLLGTHVGGYDAQTLAQSLTSYFGVSVK